MRFSVESRVPFLDHRLVETSLNLNSNLIIDKAKKIRESVKTIVPLEIVNRIDKKGFSNPRSGGLKQTTSKFDFTNFKLQ